jgi:hypothetical protein
MNTISSLIRALVSSFSLGVVAGDDVGAESLTSLLGAAPGNPEQEAPKVKKTRAERAAALREKAAALLAKAVKLETTTDDVEDDDKPALQYSAGDTVAFLFGRGDNQVELSGKVLGIRVPQAGEKGGTVVKILTGEGYDQDIKGVFPSKILRVVAYADGRPVADVPPEVDVDLTE